MTFESQLKQIVNSSYTLDNIKLSSAPRCSMLCKFCPVAFVIGQIQGDSVGESFTKDFYCSIGTVVHSTIQRWLGISGFLYGNWVCSKCGCFIDEGFGPIKHCGEYGLYEEYQLNWDILSGHCDGIIEQDNEFYVLELKTISLSGLNTRVKENKPYEYHEAQANFYTFMAQKLKLKYPIVGHAIIYITRDNPNIIKVFRKKGVDFKKVKETVKLFKDTQQMLITGDFNNIQKYCSENELDISCPYRSICSRKDIQKVLEEMFVTCRIN
jgi:hypothetical protein